MIIDCKKAADICCIQETWLKAVLDLTIKGYDSVRRDGGEANGGGCIMLIQQDTQYSVVGKGRQMEYRVIEIWANMKIVHFYNAANNRWSEALDELADYLEGKVICGGDLNAHSTLWDSKNDSNGALVEE